MSKFIGMKGFIFSLFNIRKDFETTFVLTGCLLLFLSCLLVTGMNIWLGPSSSVTLLSGVCTLWFAVLLVYGRLYQNIIVLKWVVSISALIFINVGWYYNYASNGPVLFTYLAFFAFLVVVWEKKILRVFMAFMFFNIVALLLLELSDIERFDQYYDKPTQIMDAYITFLVAAAVVFVFLSIVKKNYYLQLKEAQKTNDLKDAFLCNVSHELRTPLNAIVGFSKIISENNLSEEARRNYANIIKVNSDYLARGVSDLLNVSLLESQLLEINSAYCHLGNLFQQLKRDYQRELLNLNNYSVRVICTSAESDPIVYTDYIKLEQILRSLLSNAIKYTSEGVIRFGCQSVNGITTFFVQDTGIGIKKEDRMKIFDRFVKIDNDKYYQGIGIGLYLTRQLVEILKGKIWVKSSEGHGSAFFFTVPHLKAEKEIAC